MFMLCEKRSISVALLFSISLFCGTGASAQGKGANPQAQARYEAGLAAREKGDYVTAAAEFRKAIDLDHQFIDAHLGFIEASTVDKPGERRGGFTVKDWKLLEIYEGWMTEDPSLSWTYSLALGLTVVNMPDNAEKGLEQACILKPEVTSYLVRAAADAEPRDPRLALNYTRGLKSCDPVQHAKNLQSIVARYPKDPIAIEALKLYAAQTKTISERATILERIRNDFAAFAPHDQAARTENYFTSAPYLYDSSMRQLFGIYLRTHADKAQGLTEQMAKANPEDRAWGLTSDLQHLVVQAGRTPLPGSAQNAMKQAQTQLTLLQGETAISLADIASTYGFLCKLVAESPVEPLKSALYKLGARLWPKKSREQVDEDVWQLLTKEAQEFKTFELVTFDGGKTRLSDLRGKVVMVNFWFPTCTGCVAEFPYFQNLLDRYHARKAKFVLLAINMRPEQDYAVQPFLKQRNFTFTALKVPDGQWAERKYGIESAPGTFLLDGQGQLIYKPGPVHSPEELETLESQIDMLLTHAPTQSKGE